MIRRELTVAEGDGYNQSKIDKSTTNLKDLGFFKDQKITSAAGSTPSQVVLDTAVTEQATGQFSLGGGYSSSLGALANAGLSQNNFLGTRDQRRDQRAAGAARHANQHPASTVRIFSTAT